MKKHYTHPEFEIVNIQLVTDVLFSSTEVETEVPSHNMGDFDDEFD